MKKNKLYLTLGIIGGIAIIILIAFFLFWGGGKTETDDNGGFLSGLFPLGNNGATTEPDTPETNGKITEEIIRGNLVQLTSFAVSGATFNEETKKVQYFEKQTGHLYEIDPYGAGKEQLTITTIPRIFEAEWSNDSSKAVLSYFNAISEEGLAKETIKTFVASSLSKSATGFFLPVDTFDFSVSPSGDTIFYLVKNESGVSGVTSSFEDTDKKEIFSFDFSDFWVDWPQENAITLTTKPLASSGGYLYALNPNTGFLTKILGGINGLTTLYSPYENMLLYSVSEKNSVYTTVYDVDAKKTANLETKTLPEKCFFSKKDTEVVYCAVPKDIPNANYPDDWYKGLFFFEDTISKMDTKTGSVNIVLEDSSFDIINLFSNEEESHLFFQDKKDGTLWSYRLD